MTQSEKMVCDNEFEKSMTKHLQNRIRDNLLSSNTESHSAEYIL